MEETIFNAIPTEGPNITIDDISNDNYELIFVQHSQSLSTQDVQDALEKRLAGQKSDKISLFEHEGKVDVYPIAVENGSLHLTHPVDHYYVALNQEE